MSTALDLHDALLRSLLKRFYGYEVRRGRPIAVRAVVRLSIMPAD